MISDHDVDVDDVDDVNGDEGDGRDDYYNDRNDQAARVQYLCYEFLSLIQIHDKLYFVFSLFLGNSTA